MPRRSRNMTSLFKASGRFLKWLSPDEASDLIDSRLAKRCPEGLIMIDATPKRLQLPNAGISVVEMEMNAGVYGPETFFNTDICSISKAKRKIEVWPDIHDDRAVVISAGRVCQPGAQETQGT